MGQRERIEHLDLLHPITVAQVQADTASERYRLATDVRHPRDPGGGSSTATSVLVCCIDSARHTESV
jgi:hypothetical protein